MEKYIFVPQKKQITTDEYIQFVVDRMGKSMKDLKIPLETHIDLGLVTEAGELLSELHKWEAFGKALDCENILEKLGDLLFYIVAKQDKKFGDISIFDDIYNSNGKTALNTIEALINAIMCLFANYHAAVFIAARQQFEFTIDQIIQYNYEKLLNRPLAGEYYKNNSQQQQQNNNMQQYKSGMIREPQNSRERFDLITPLCIPYNETMLYRWACLVAKGAEKYGDRNWEKANGEEEQNRFRESAFRHFMKWFYGQDDEDHAAAVMFNISGFEMVISKNKQKGVI